MKEVKLFSTFPLITDLEIILVMFFPASLTRMEYRVLRQCQTWHSHVCERRLTLHLTWCRDSGPWGVAGVAAGRRKRSASPKTRPGVLTGQTALGFIRHSSESHPLPLCHGHIPGPLWGGQCHPPRGRSNSLSDESDVLSETRSFLDPRKDSYPLPYQ